ncbi:uncharacterized protein LOC144076352 isoform X2 [Stigmatopora argus]
MIIGGNIVKCGMGLVCHLESTSNYENAAFFSKTFLRGNGKFKNSWTKFNEWQSSLHFARLRKIGGHLLDYFDPHAAAEPAVDLPVGRDDDERAERGVERREEDAQIGHQRVSHGLPEGERVHPKPVVYAVEDHVQSDQGHHGFGRPALRSAAAPQALHLLAVLVEEQQDDEAAEGHQSHGHHVSAHLKGPVDLLGALRREVDQAELHVDAVEGRGGRVPGPDGEENGGGRHAGVDQPEGQEHQAQTLIGAEDKAGVAKDVGKAERRQGLQETAHRHHVQVDAGQVEHDGVGCQQVLVVVERRQEGQDHRQVTGDAHHRQGQPNVIVTHSTNASVPATHPLTKPPVTRRTYSDLDVAPPPKRVPTLVLYITACRSSIQLLQINADDCFRPFGFIIVTGIGILGNTVVLLAYANILYTDQKLLPVDMILCHLAFSNLMILLIRGVPQTMTVFGFTELLNDSSCKLVIYGYRVGRALSICLTCTLSVFQALTIAPSTSRFSWMKSHLPSLVLPTFAGLWFLNMVIYISALLFSTAPHINSTVPAFTLNLGFCLMDFRDSMLYIVQGVIVSGRDFSVVALMLVSSGYILHVLHRHSHQVRGVRRTRSAEIRAAKTVVTLVVLYVFFFGVDNVIWIYMLTEANVSPVVADIRVFCSSCYAFLSPYFIISSNKRVKARVVCVADQDQLASTEAPESK